MEIYIIVATATSKKKVKPPLKIGVYLRTTNGMTKVNIIMVIKIQSSCNSFPFIVILTIYNNLRGGIRPTSPLCLKNSLYTILFVTMEDNCS